MNPKEEAIRLVKEQYNVIEKYYCIYNFDIAIKSKSKYFKMAAYHALITVDRMIEQLDNLSAWRNEIIFIPEQQINLKNIKQEITNLKEK